MKVRNIILVFVICACFCLTLPFWKKVVTKPEGDSVSHLEQSQQTLPKPKAEIACLEDFIYVLNYMAFYRMEEKLTFSFSPSYRQTFYNPYTEFQKAYTQADLADVYACHLDDSQWSTKGVIGIHYSMSRDIASKPPQKKTQLAVIPSFDWKKAKQPIRSLPLEDNQAKPAIACDNGEQLYFLAMNGYRPLPKKGSQAEKLYQAAKSVLLERIDQSMDRFEQIKAVYDWLTTEIAYDTETAYSLETYLVAEQAYYLEGVFYNHYAVCDGKAKAYALLLNMLEIPCLRDTGKSEMGDHAWNMVQLEGKWYLSCTTYGQAQIGGNLQRTVPNYSMLLSARQTPYKDSWGYESQKHLAISSQVEETSYPVYQKMTVKNRHNLQVQSIEDLESLLTMISTNQTADYKVEFEYLGSNKDFQDQLLSYVEKSQATHTTSIKSEGGPVYQVIYRKEP